MFPEVNSIMEFFWRNPTTVVHLRQLARKTDYSPAGARKVLKKLVKANLVVERKTKVVNNYHANILHSSWVRHKKAWNLYSLYKSELVQYLVDKYDEPEAIVVFGSYARGDDIEKSDIDIAVVTSEEKSLNLAKFEKRLSRKINIIEVEMKKAKKEFLNNLANGIVLHGYLRLV